MAESNRWLRHAGQRTPQDRDAGRVDRFGCSQACSESYIQLYTYIIHIDYHIESPREQFFKAVLRVLEERWKEFKNDPVKDWSRNSSRTQCWSGSQSDQNCFAQHWRCRQWMPIKEIGRRDCKICRAADFCFVYLSSFIGLDIFARLQSLPDIARHCDILRELNRCVFDGFCDCSLSMSRSAAPAFSCHPVPL